MAYELLRRVYGKSEDDEDISRGVDTTSTGQKKGPQSTLQGEAKKTAARFGIKRAYERKKTPGANVTGTGTGTGAVGRNTAEVPKVATTTVDAEQKSGGGVPTANAKERPVPGGEGQVAKMTATPSPQGVYQGPLSRNAITKQGGDTTYGTKGESITVHGASKIDPRAGRSLSPSNKLYNAGGGRYGVARGRGPRQVAGSYQRPSREPKERRIEPPKSIGDLIRYKREVAELKRERAHADRTARTNIARDTARSSAQLGASRETAAQKQQALENQVAAEERNVKAQSRQKIDALSQEYSNPNTTDDRKLEIEREMAVQSGKQPARPTEKNLKMTEKEKADRQQKDDEFYLENRKKVGMIGNRRYETMSEMLKRIRGEQETGASDSVLPAEADRVANETTTVGGDGKTYTWTGTGWRL